MLLKSFAFLSLFFFLSKAFAGPFVVNENCAAAVNGAGIPDAAIRAQLISNCQQAFQNMETEVNRKLPEADQSTYLKGMANSSVMAVKGSGVDYANEIELFVVGMSVGAGVDVGDNSFSSFRKGDVDSEQLRGFGVAPSLMVGLNLGIFDLPTRKHFDPNRIKLMLNFFSLNLSQFSDTISGKVTNIGVHGRYRLIDHRDIVPRGIVRWNGVDLTTGIVRNSLKIQFNQKFEDTFTDGDDQFTASIDGLVVAGADITTTAIPVMVTTGIQLGYVFTLYGGLGVDINLGSAKSLATVNADINATSPDLPSGTEVEGEGVLDLGDKGKPTTLFARGLFGVQINIPVLKIYAQLEKALNESVYGLNTGIRLTW